MEFETKVIARIVFGLAVLGIIFGAIWWRRYSRRNTIAYTRQDYVDALQQMTPYTAYTVSGDIIYRLVCSTTRTEQQFFVLKVSGKYFRVAVLQKQWNGSDKPRIAFRGWAEQILPGQLLGPEDLLPNYPEDTGPQDRLLDITTN